MSGKELPDAKINPFPRNANGDASPAAHLATWGVNHDIPPLVVGEIRMIESGRLICLFSVRVRGIGFWIRNCALVKTRYGECVYPPQSLHTWELCEVSEDGEQYETIKRKKNYQDILVFDSNKAERAFKEAALSAVRHALRRFSAHPAAPASGDGDVPFFDEERQ